MPSTQAQPASAYWFPDPYRHWEDAAASYSQLAPPQTAGETYSEMAETANGLARLQCIQKMRSRTLPALPSLSCNELLENALNGFTFKKTQTNISFI